MFLWLAMDFNTHPLIKKFGGPKLAKALWVLWTHKPYLVLVTPGTVFSPSKEIADEQGWKYFRLCFAAIDEADLGPTSSRFVEGIQAFWRIKDAKLVDELLEEGGFLMSQIEGENISALVGPC